MKETAGEAHPRWARPATKAEDRRIGMLEVWWHRVGPRGGDYPESQAVSGVMGARALARALEREPDRYHFVQVMRWDGAVWKRVTRP